MDADLYKIGLKHGTDKFTHHRYDRFYSRYLETFREQEFNLLEIGVDTGASIKTWREYFPNADIFGADIQPPSINLPRVTFLRIDQGSEKDLTWLIQRTGPCRIIIDDGSHQPEHQLLTFTSLFSSCLEPGGVYIVEDIETSYWKNSQFHLPYLFYGFVDDINSEFSRKPNSLDIESITFAHNCIIVVKASESNRSLLHRSYRFKEHI